MFQKISRGELSAIPISLLFGCAAKTWLNFPLMLWNRCSVGYSVQSRAAQAKSQPKLSEFRHRSSPAQSPPEAFLPQLSAEALCTTPAHCCARSHVPCSIQVNYTPESPTRLVSESSCRRILLSKGNSFSLLLSLTRITVLKTFLSIYNFFNMYNMGIQLFISQGNK